MPLRTEREGFSKRLSQIIEERQLKLKDISAAVGCSATAVHKWTRGGEIDYGNLRKLADFLNVSWAWLRYGEEGAEAGASASGIYGELNQMRRKYLEQIIQSEARMRLAQENAGIIDWEINLLTGELYNSRSHEREFDVAIRTMDDMLAFIHPDDREGMLGAIARAAETGQRYEYDYRVVLPGRDETRWMIGRGMVIADGEQRPVKLSGVSMDITERKKAEAAAANSEQRLRLALGAARMGDWELDPATGRMTCGAQAADLMGFPRGATAIAETDWLARVHADDRERVRAARRQPAPEGGDPVVTDYRVETGGRTRRLREYALAQRGADSGEVRIFGLLQAAPGEA